jgi:hypothetical protein
MRLRYWNDKVSSVVRYYDSDEDDDDPTLVDSDGVEYGYCVKGDKAVPLSAITWDGSCRDCEVCDA